MIIHGAHAAGYRTVFAQGVGEDKSCHTHIEGVLCVIHLIYHVIMDDPETFFSVIVIRVDDKERLLN